MSAATPAGVSTALTRNNHQTDTAGHLAGQAERGQS